MNSKNKIYIISGALAIFTILMVVVCIFLLNEIVKKSEDLAFGKSQVFSLEKEFTDIEGFKKQYGNYQPNLVKIDQLFIDSHNPVDFFRFLEKTASDHGLKLNVSIPKFSGTAVISGDFQISLFGDFPKIVEFIQAIENGQYLIQIKSLNIAKQTVVGSFAKEQVSNQFNATVSMSVLAK